MSVLLVLLEKEWQCKSKDPPCVAETQKRRNREASSRDARIFGVNGVEKENPSTAEV